MKIHTHAKQAAQSATFIERKQQPARSGTKAVLHRHERRKIREQLRHLDWALAGAD